MKHLRLLLLAIPFIAMARDNQSKFDFYGRIRADLFYNSRENNETVDGLFYMFPKDYEYDENGNDLNATPQGNMYMLYTRLGVNVSGIKIGSANTSAVVEVDFRGAGTSYAMPRIRHAYVNFDWTHSQLLIGQTWHPLFGDVSPSMLNLSTGAPFQPFNRSPLIRYRYCGTYVQATAAAIWQQQYTSVGPEGKTHDYLKYSNIPELYVGVDYRNGGVLAGIGAEMLSLVPRQSNGMHKVSERITSASLEAHAKYTADNWSISAKTLLADNLTHCSMIGGYAVTGIGKNKVEWSYTPFHHSMTWINFVYGKTWQPGIFIGYLKNLGTGKQIVGQKYGVGLDVDQLMSFNLQLSYNIPHWKVGVEFTPTTAWYGATDLNNGKVINTHSVTNYRVLAVMMYIF